MPWNSVTPTRSPLSWWHPGSSHFSLQQWRCQLQNPLCYQWLVPSSRAYRITSKASFAAFLTQYCPESNLVSLIGTISWVTIIISMTCLLSILGLHVCRISFEPLYPDWQSLVLDPHISYEGLKIDYDDDLVLSNHLKDSKTSLFEYFDENYDTYSPMPLTLPSTPVQALPADGLP